MRAKKNHGMSQTRAHRIWRSMLVRVYCKHRPAYADYGGRGIEVCERWRESFLNFHQDMGDAPDGMSIDRIDNSKGYEPGNCQWATRKQQSLNSRHNRLITYLDETHPLSVWAERLNKNYQTLHNRLQKGWPLERVFGHPCKEFNGTSGPRIHTSDRDNPLQSSTL